MRSVLNFAHREPILKRCPMIKHIAVLVTLCAAGAAYAGDYKLGAIAIDHPWVRPTAEGTKTGAAYLLLTNKGSAADKLVSASSPVAGKTQIHQTSDEGGVMKMREVVGGIELAPGATVALKPGGYHIMLIDLKQKLDEGRHIPLTLTFAKAGSIDVEVDVEKKSREQSHGATGMDPGMH